MNKLVYSRCIGRWKPDSNRESGGPWWFKDGAVCLLHVEAGAH